MMKAPAIVFGTDPETKNFFVGTKRLFNKKKIMINYDHNDIDRNHGHNKGCIYSACGI